MKHKHEIKEQSTLLSQDLENKQYVENSRNNIAFKDVNFNQTIQWTNGPDYQQCEKERTNALWSQLIRNA